jgi:ADP-ribose pyrophosphatase YjhB (NUDIX family)
LNTPVNLKQELYLIADEIRGAATLSKYFADNVYESERAARLMELAAKVAALAEGDPSAEQTDHIKAQFEADGLSHMSPVNSVEAVIFNPKEELLLIQRKDNGKWALPGGLAEIGHTLPESALRELWEEAGVRGHVERLLGLFDARLWGTFTKFHLLHFVFQVTCDDFTPTPGIECLDARYFPLDKLPLADQMHGGHAKRIPVAIEMWRTGETYFDPADSRRTDMPMHQRPA